MESGQRLSPVLKLPVQVDVERLLNELLNVQLMERFQANEMTLSLVNRGLDEDPWRSGTTLRVIEDADEFPFSEADFKFINEPLQGSYFEHCYQQAQEILNRRAGRVRVFKRIVQTSSSLHQDLDVRLHLALQSNPGAFLVFPGEGLFQIPVDGHFYLVDTTRPHFAVNANDHEDRLHLIFDTYCGFPEKRSLSDKILSSAQSLFHEIAERPGVEPC